MTRNYRWCFGLIVLFALFIFVLPAQAQITTAATSPDTASLERTSSYLKNINAQVKTLIGKVNQGSAAERETAKISLRTVLTDRKNEMLTLARQSPRLFLTLVMSDTDRTAITPELQTLVEKKASIRGPLEVFHSDFLLPDGKGFDPERSRYDYAIRDDKQQKINFYPTTFLGLRSGVVVSVSGYQLDSSIVASVDNPSSFQLISEPSFTEVASASSTTKKVLVLLVNFINDTRQPWTIDQVRNEIFTGTNSVNKYYQETSFGKLALVGKIRPDGDIYGWFTLDNINCNPNTLSTIAERANVAAIAAGIDVSGYGNIIYAWPHNISCGFAGAAWYGGLPGLSYINGYADSLYVVGHELGHNYGMHHASAYRCTEHGVPVSISEPANCYFDEYGDTWNIMGGSAMHFRGLLPNSFSLFVVFHKKKGE